MSIQVADTGRDSSASSATGSEGAPPRPADQLRRRAKLYADLAALAGNPDTSARLKALSERFAREAEGS